jgi:hypothetical protein
LRRPGYQADNPVVKTFNWEHMKNVMLHNLKKHNILSLLTQVEKSTYTYVCENILSFIYIFTFKYIQIYKRRTYNSTVCV